MPPRRAQLEYPADVITRNTIQGVVYKDAAKVIKDVVRKTHSNFQTAGLTLDITIFNLPAKVEILSCWMNVVTAFAGPATYTISLGPAGSETTLQTAQNVKTTGLKLAVGTDFTTNRPVFSLTARTVIEARATSTVNNLDQSTAGIIDFYIVYLEHL